jgi:hypothetical protein
MVGLVLDKHTAVPFASMDPPDQFHLLLGQRLGKRATEDRIDRAVKLFLRKCWNSRTPVTESLKGEFGELNYLILFLPGLLALVPTPQNINRRDDA